MNDKRSPLMVVRDRLISRRDELSAALEGSGISADRFIRAAVTAAQTTPELAECSFNSLWIALLKACRDGLLPDGVQGAIVAFKKNAQWIPMYRGMISRFERSGQYKWIHAGFHRQRDTWRIWIDEHGQHFLHEPSSGGEDAKVIETYACATTLNGGFFISVVTEADMARIRASSRAQRDDSPWNKWPEQMMQKTALKRLCKILPMPAPIEEMMQRDDENGGGDGELEAAPTPPPRRPRGAQAALEQFASDDGPASAGDGQGAGAEPPTDSPPAAQSDVDSAGSVSRDPGSDQQVYLETAYERGKEAKRLGLTRDDIPAEYTERGRGKEAVAWRRGYNGDKP